MAISFELPSSLDPIEYLTSFAPAFAKNTEMRAALLGVNDSLRQATLLPLEPLGMLACITAEEEAATFLYYALVSKGYSIPNYEKLRRHQDKVKFLILGQALIFYFFGNEHVEFPNAIRIERDGDQPKTTRRMRVGDFEIVQDDPLETIITLGDGESGHINAVESSVDAVLAGITPKGYTIKSHIDKIANRRNLCLYGDPDRKNKFQSESQIDHFKNNCIGLIILGFLVSNGKSNTSSMVKLVGSIFSKIST